MGIEARRLLFERLHVGARHLSMGTKLSNSSSYGVCVYAVVVFGSYQDPRVDHPLSYGS